MSNPRKCLEKKAEYGPNKSTRECPAIRVGNADRDYLIRTDMREPNRLTGQWRHRGQLYHLFINHAGPHIQALIALVENGASGKDADVPRDKVRLEQRVVRLGGNADASDRSVYHLYLHDPSDPLDQTLACGQLKYAGGEWIELAFDLSGVPSSAARAKLAKLGSTRAKRFGESANLLTEQVGQSYQSEDVRSHLWFPLTPRQVSRLPGFILGARIEANAENYLLRDNANEVFGYVDLIYAFYRTAADDQLSHAVRRQRLDNVAVALDRAVWQAYQDALTCPAADGGIDNFHRDYWREAALESLASSDVVVKGQAQPKSLLTHTQDILDASHDTSLANFEKLLHLQHRIGGHYYAAELDVINVDLSADDASKKLEKLLKKATKKVADKLAEKLRRRIQAGSLLGLLMIKKQDDPAVNPKANQVSPEWMGYYGIELAGVKLSGSVGSGTAMLSSKGEAKNVYGRAWQPEQLGGRAGLIDVGGSYYGGGHGKGGSVTMLRLWGSGDGKPSVPLQLDFSGLADLFAVRPGASVSASRFVGRAIWIDSHSRDIDLPAPPEDQPYYYGGHANAAPLHFPINGAGLFPDGESLLQTFAATHLAALGGRGINIEVHGYADQPHDEFHNMILSRNRAITAFHYLKNILEDDLGARDFISEPPSEAEEEAASKKAKKQGENYDVVMPEGADVTIVAHGEPDSSDAEDKQPEYDIEHRRVEVTITGLVKLALRRTSDRRE